MAHTRFRFLVIGGLLLVAIPRASAHHSFSAVFDINQPITMKGVVTKVRLENPHSWFFLDVTDSSGNVEKWAFEATTPTSLIRSGVKPSFVKPGDEVTIKGFRARDMSQLAGVARELVLADGRAFAIGPALGSEER
jgi:hypothetical protein